MRAFKILSQSQVHNFLKLIFVILFLCPPLVNAEDMPPLDNEPAEKPHNKALPFGFYSDSMETAIGIGGIATGNIQPQATLFGLGVVSSNDSWLYYVAALNFQIPSWKQWLFNLDGYNAKFSEGRYYIRNNTSISLKDDAQRQITTTGYESFIRPQAKYIFPWAKGEQGAANSLRGPRTLSALKPITSWDPTESGISSLNITGKWQRRDIGIFNNLQPTEEIVAYSMDLDYDNRNSLHIPSDGGKINLKTTYDPGSNDRPSWQTVELESAFFFDLGATSWAQQQSIGLSAWSADTPSWNNTSKINNKTVYNRPPDFAGVSLGGWDRLRGYYGGHFFDRSAVAYSAEFRLIPAWQPLKELPLIKTFNIPWWQWVFFLDLGNSHDQYNIAKLHSEFDYSVGTSLRLSIEGVLLRMDYSVSAEQTQLRVLVNQPF